MSGKEKFGQDHGLIGEAIVTMRKFASPDTLRRFFSALAHDEDVCRRVLDMVLKSVSSVLKPLTSAGVTGKKWTARLENTRSGVGDSAKQILLSKSFVPTTGTVYHPVLIRGDEFAIDADRTNKNVREEALCRCYQTPPAELAPMLRETLSNEEIREIGLDSLVVMHEPITDSNGEPRVLGIGRFAYQEWIFGYYGHPGHQWDRQTGFVFLAPRV